MFSLPIESILSELKSSLLSSPQIILQAPPGAGKSTFLPFTMVKEKWFSGKIIMLEPRRLAAKNIAHYLASLFNEKVGESIGYRMRGETCIGKNTQLEIVTEGVLTRLLQNDPELTGVDLLIFDEFHERNLQGDLGLALALDVQESLCESLKILIMSATLDNNQLQVQLPNSLMISSQGRSYPIEIIYQSESNNQHNLIIDLVKLTCRAYAEQTGNILLFVAGVKEIKQCQAQLASRLSDDVIIAPLYGALSLVEQQMAINQCQPGKRKIVIATNIAETSLTIEGITVVVDSGLERSMSYQAQSGIGKLLTQRISDASATQRAGRAGRLSAGVCYRLWSQERRLSPQSEAEITRCELTSLVLELLNWGVESPQQIKFITQPPQAHIEAAKALLKTFKAIDNKGRISKHGQAMSALGVNPRLAHLLVSATSLEIEGVVNLACLLVALLESNERSGDDIEALLLKPSYLVKQQQSVLLKKLNIKLSRCPLPLQYCGLLLAIAFPDRIAQSRGDGMSYQLSSGIGASLFHDSALVGKEMLVVADLAFSERNVNSVIYKASVISLATLEQYLGHYFQEAETLYWSFSGKQTRLIAEKRLLLGKLTIKKQPITHVTQKQKSEALIAGIKKSGLSVLTWSDENQQLLVRLQYAYLQYQHHQYKLDFPCFSAQSLLEELDDWLVPYLNGISKPEQLRQLDIKGALLARLTWPNQQAFEKHFPTHAVVPTGSKIKISYREDENPVLSVRLQELFGQQETPCIFEGRIKLQLALLSPARKLLQLTQDLTTFWLGAYIDVKKEMRGRYPKHYWPDDPLQAQATRRVKKYM